MSKKKKKKNIKCLWKQFDRWNWKLFQSMVLNRINEHFIVVIVGGGSSAAAFAAVVSINQTFIFASYFRFVGEIR